MILSYVHNWNLIMLNILKLILVELLVVHFRHSKQRVKKVLSIALVHLCSDILQMVFLRFIVLPYFHLFRESLRIFVGTVPIGFVRFLTW